MKKIHSKCSKYIGIKNNLKITKKNATNAKHPQMFTYKMTVVSVEEARDGGRTKK